jgi:hypothetical protein
VIEKTIELWHAHLRGELEGGLDELLADDCTFYSPIVFTPQEGKELTKLYLNAAGNSLGGDDAPKGKGGAGGGKFRYVKEIVQGDSAMLEFETTVGGKYVNGIDIITCNEEGKICEFKVMVRPLQAINLVHANMKAMLEKMQAKG